MRLFGVILLLGSMGFMAFHIFQVQNGGAIVATSDAVDVFAYSKESEDSFLLKDYHLWKVNFKPVSLTPQMENLKIVLVADNFGLYSKGADRGKTISDMEFALTDIKSGNIIYQSSGNPVYQDEGKQNGEHYLSLGHMIVPSASDYQFSMNFGLLKSVIALQDRTPTLSLRFVSGGVDVNPFVMLISVGVMLFGGLICLITRPRNTNYVS